MAPRKRLTTEPKDGYLLPSGVPVSSSRGLWPPCPSQLRMMASLSAIAACFGRSLRLHVVHVQVGHAAVEVNHDHRFRAALGLSAGPQAQEIGQAESAGAEGANAQELPAGYAIARGYVVRAPDGEHEMILQIR